MARAFRAGQHAAGQRKNYWKRLGHQHELTPEEKERRDLLSCMTNYQRSQYCRLKEKGEEMPIPQILEIMGRPHWKTAILQNAFEQFRARAGGA